MTFPGAGARIFYNEAGEPLGWDYPDYDPEPMHCDLCGTDHYQPGPCPDDYNEEDDEDT